MSGPPGLMGIGVTVARLTLNQLVQVRILDPQLGRLQANRLQHPKRQDGRPNRNGRLAFNSRNELFIQQQQQNPLLHETLQAVPASA